MATALPAGQLAWGFPQAGGGFSAAGVLEGALFAKVHFGTFGTAPTARELAVRRLFQQSGFTIEEHSDFRGWLWIHFAILTGFFAQALSTGTVAEVMASGAAGKACIRGINELLRVVEARGITLSNNAAEFSTYRLPPWLGSLGMRVLLAVNPPFKAAFASAINVPEAQACCRDMLAEAHRLGISVPRLEAAEWR